MFNDDEMRKRGRGRNSGLSQFGQQLNALRGYRPNRSMMGVGSGGGFGGASGFALNRRQAPVMNLPARPATGGVFSPSMPQVPSVPDIEFTESDLTPDIASQVPPSQTSPVSQPPQAPVSANPGSGTASTAPMGTTGNAPQMGGGMPQMPSWMQAPSMSNIPGIAPAKALMDQFNMPYPRMPQMPQFGSGGGNIPRQ